MGKRYSGIFLHISSLPCKYGVGDLGREAYKFVDFLVSVNQTYWQVLPINSLMPVSNNYSPYNSSSAFAGNTLFISLELLYEQGFLSKKDIQCDLAFDPAKVNYRLSYSYKKKLFDVAYEKFKINRGVAGFERFCAENSYWLENHAMFAALSDYFHNQPWSNWSIDIRERRKDSVKSIKKQLSREIDREKFLQYVFFKQWYDLKRYCNKCKIKLIGDIPFYVAFQSADVWANPELFKLTRTKEPHFISGVPPDSFSRNGQLWGNPVYNWKMLQKQSYRWWLQRVGHNLDLFDIVRLDHFRGFAGFWQVPAGSKTAENGKWIRGPRENFLDKLFKYFPSSSFIAEDLGHITPDVKNLIEKYQLTCMKVLMFGFDIDMPKNPYCPHNFISNSIVYTGTHDNNTIRGWFETEISMEQKKRLFSYIGHKVPGKLIHWELIRLAMSSVSDIAIVPMSDVLGLNEQARMNYPATVRGNWIWRLQKKDLKFSAAKKLAEITEVYGRA